MSDPVHGINRYEIKKHINRINSLCKDNDRDYYFNAIEIITDLYKEGFEKLDSPAWLVLEDMAHILQEMTLENPKRVYKILAENFPFFYSNLDMPEGDLRAATLLDIDASLHNGKTLNLSYKENANKFHYEKNNDFLSKQKEILFTNSDKSILDDYAHHSDEIKTSTKKTREHDELIAILGKVLEENSSSDHQDMGWIKDKIDQIDQNSIYSDEILERQTRKSQEIEQHLSQAEVFLGKAATTGLYNIQNEAFDSFKENYKKKNRKYKRAFIWSISIYALCAFYMIDHITNNLPAMSNKKIIIFSITDIIYILKWSLPSIIITTLLFQFLGLMKREMVTAQVMMEAYRHKTSMIMSSIGFKKFFGENKKSEELILSEMIKALAHNPTDDLKQMQKVKQDMPIDKAFGIIDKGLDKIVTVKEKIDKSFGKKPDASKNENEPPQS